MNITGVDFSSGSRLISWYRETPERLGIMTSRQIRSGLSLRAIPSPSWPSMAEQAA
jgi:hypothetical protein